MQVPARLPTPGRNRLDTVYAMAAVAAVVALSVAANARRRVAQRVTALRHDSTNPGSAEEPLAEPVAGP